MNPLISFYILSSQTDQDRYQFACKLAEKAFRENLSCLIQTQNSDQCKRLDDLLWTFRAGSFVPHQISAGSDHQESNSICIGNDITGLSEMNLLINLDTNHPSEINQFERIFEIVSNEEQSKIQGRKKYRYYQDAGLQIDTHLI